MSTTPQKIGFAGSMLTGIGALGLIMNFIYWHSVDDADVDPKLRKTIYAASTLTLAAGLICNWTANHMDVLNGSENKTNETD